MSESQDTPPTRPSWTESEKANARLDARPRRASRVRTVPDQDPGSFFGDLGSDISWFFKFLGDRQARMPGRTKAILVFAILYAIMPIDLIPDFIPGVGIIDDALVLGMVVSSLRTMVANYRKWRQPVVENDSP